MRGCSLATVVSAIALSAASAADVQQRRSAASRQSLPGLSSRGRNRPDVFMTYGETRPWAKAIKQAVATKKMPPWFADPHLRQVVERPVDDAAGDRHADRVGGCGRAGRRCRRQARATRIRRGLEHCHAGLVVSDGQAVSGSRRLQDRLPVHRRPAESTEDKWVQMVEARPSDRSVVHHIVVFIRDPKSKWLRGEAEPGVPFVPERTGRIGAPMSAVAATKFCTSTRREICPMSGSPAKRR